MSVLSTHSPIARLTPYTKDMNNKPMIKAHNGAFMLNETAASLSMKAPLCALIMGLLFMSLV